MAQLPHVYSSPPPPQSLTLVATKGHKRLKLSLSRVSVLITRDTENLMGADISASFINFH